MRLISWCALMLAMVLAVVSPSFAADESARVKAFADGLASRALIIVQNEGLSAEAKQRDLEALFDSHVDIAWVSRFVLGKHWKTATPDQQKAYQANYKAFVLKNYTSKLTNYTGQEYKIKSVRPEGDGEYLLTMELVNTNEPNVMLDYRIRKVGNDFKIFDIVVEGVSMITTQRSEFGSVVGNKGLPFLINALAKKAQAAAAK